MTAPLHIRFTDLGPTQCRWPYGDGPFTFCGRPIEDPNGQHPYCGPHNRASHQPRIEGDDHG